MEIKKPQFIPSKIRSWLLTLGLLLTGIGGGFVPWIWRESVALQLTAPGLAEFVKFLPEIRSGQIQIERLYFLLPLFLAMLTLPLFASNNRLSLPNWYRWSLRLVVVPLALASLSPVWTPAILRAPEFRLQTLLAVIAIGLALIAPLLKNLPLKLLVTLSGVGGILALILPAWQFSLVQASIAEAYHEPVSLGWGWWLTVGGIIINIAGGIWVVFMPDFSPKDATDHTSVNSNDNPAFSKNNLKLTFQPHPLVRNRHVQTIVSSLFNQKGPNLLAASQEMILDAGQGVRLQGFYSPQPKGQSKGLVLILHGWLGNANANYIMATGEYLYKRGYSIFRLNFRDHGGTYHLNPGIFRGDLLDEVVEAAQRIAELERKPFHIIGASMGGSFALRLAWRHSQTAIPNLGHTIAINPSISPLHTTQALDTGLLVYLAYFRRKWRKAFKNKKAAFPDRYDISEVIAASTCMAMTEAFIPFSPYPNARTYLDSYAVTPEMMAVLQSPVTIITAADDPIVPVADFDSLCGVSTHLEISVQPYGGHVGFIDIFPVRHWINDAIFTILETSPSPTQPNNSKV